VGRAEALEVLYAGLVQRQDIALLDDEPRLRESLGTLKFPALACFAY
jgi:hypothetical protein